MVESGNEMAEYSVQCKKNRSNAIKVLHAYNEGEHVS